MEGLVIECPPLTEMKLGTCVYGDEKCSEPVSESKHVILCAKHYRLVMEKHCSDNDLNTKFSLDYNQQIYDIILPLIDLGIHQLMNLKAFDSREKQLYQALTYAKAFILIYRRYLNPGYEGPMNTALMMLSQNLGRPEVVCVISKFVAILGCFGIILVACDLGYEIPVGAGLAVGGGLTAGIAIRSPSMFGALIAAAPAFPIILGGAIGAAGMGLIFNKVMNRNVPPPPRNQWCRITLWLYPGNDCDN